MLNLLDDDGGDDDAVGDHSPETMRSRSRFVRGEGIELSRREGSLSLVASKKVSDSSFLTWHLFKSSA